MPLFLLVIYAMGRPVLIFKEKLWWKNSQFSISEAVISFVLSLALAGLILYSHLQFTSATSTVYLNFNFEYPAWISLLVMYGVDLALVGSLFRSLKKRNLFWQYLLSTIYSILLMFTVEFMMLVLSSIILLGLSKFFV